MQRKNCHPDEQKDLLADKMRITFAVKQDETDLSNKNNYGQKPVSEFVEILENEELSSDTKKSSNYKLSLNEIKT